MTQHTCDVCGKPASVLMWYDAEDGDVYYCDLCRIDYDALMSDDEDIELITKEQEEALFEWAYDDPPEPEPLIDDIEAFSTLPPHMEDRDDPRYL